MQVLRRALAVFVFGLIVVIGIFVTHIGTLPVRTENWPPDFPAREIYIAMPLTAAVLFVVGLGAVYLFGKLWGSRLAMHTAWCFYLFGCGLIFAVVYGNALMGAPMDNFTSMFAPWFAAAFVSWRTAPQTVFIAEMRARKASAPPMSPP